MNATVSQCPADTGCTVPGDPACCEAVIAYANAPSARKAVQIYERLLHQFGTECVFHCTWCKFDQLDPADFRATARGGTAGADIVLLATPGAGELPPNVKEWVKQWAAQDGSADRAIVALIGCEPALAMESSPVDHYLQDISRCRDVDYFALWFDLPGGMTDINQPAIEERAVTVTPLLAEILANPAAQPNWWHGQAS